MLYVALDALQAPALTDKLDEGTHGEELNTLVIFGCGKLVGVAIFDRLFGMDGEGLQTLSLEMITTNCPKPVTLGVLFHVYLATEF